ncbi:MAG: hypothetical protein ACRD1X_20280 [Vicinamibacteria bacterium]
MTKKWNRADRLALLRILVAIVGVLASLIIAPNPVPEVAVLHDSEEDAGPGLAVSRQTFSNISYSLPVFDLEARWQFDCSSVQLTSDGSAPATTTCDTAATAALLTVEEALPARGWVKAILAAPSAFTLPPPKVKAFQLTVNPAGSALIPVMSLDRQNYAELLEQRNTNLGISLLIGIGVITGFWLLTKRFA